MKITVVGGGAMGSLYAALMADNGHKVSIVDPWLEHINEIRENGLRVEGASGSRIVNNITTYNDIENVENSDIYIVATKTSQVTAVAQKMAKIIKEETLVITIQNGLGSGEKMSQHINPKNIILGVAEGFGSSIVKPGQVHHNAMKLIRLGEMKKMDFGRVKKLAGLWSDCGFNVKAFKDIDRLIWEKFICNVTFSGPCTVFNCNIGELMSRSDQWSIALGCMQEAYKISINKKISLSFDNPVSYVLEFGRRMPKAKPSMLLDHEARRPSEIDAINGMVLNLGQSMKISTPYNEVITSLILFKEKQWV